MAFGMITEKIKKPKRMVGEGYVAPWSDGTLGWVMPSHVDGYAPANRCEKKTVV